MMMAWAGATYLSLPVLAFRISRHRKTVGGVMYVGSSGPAHFYTGELFFVELFDILETDKSNFGGRWGGRQVDAAEVKNYGTS